MFSLLHVAAFTAALGWTQTAAIFFAGQPEPTDELLNAINAEALAVPEDQRAWPVYRRAITRINHAPDADRLGEMIESRPGDEHWDEFAAWLVAHGDVIADIHEAAARPHLGRPLQLTMPAEDLAIYRTAAPDPNPPIDPLLILGAPTPLGQLRFPGRLLTADLLAAAEVADADRLLADSAALHGLARHAADGQMLIADLIALWINQLHARSLGEALQADGLAVMDADQLQQLQSSFDPLRRRAWVELAGERAAMLDLFQHTYSRGGIGGGLLTDEGLRRMPPLLSGAPPLSEPMLAIVGPPLMLLQPGRDRLEAEVHAWFNAAEHALQVPPHEDWYPIPDIDEMPAWWHLRYGLLAVALPPLDAGRITEFRHDDAIAGLQVAIALERYRREHGGYPPVGALDALVPDYLDAVPIGGASGQPMRWVWRDEGGVTVYGFGTDGDDDGGVPPPDDRFAAFRPPERAGDGDWVVYPWE